MLIADVIKANYIKCILSNFLITFKCTVIIFIYDHFAQYFHSAPFEICDQVYCFFIPIKLACLPIFISGYAPLPFPFIILNIPTLFPSSMVLKIRSIQLQLITMERQLHD